MTPADAQRRRELAMIHIAKKELALADDTYRSVLIRVTGKDSSAALDARGREALLAEFKRLGWKYRKLGTPKRAGVQSGPARRPAETPIARKARALWVSLYQLGAVDDASEAAFVAFARRQTGVDDPAWITPAQADKLIEALKARCEREGYVATEERVRDMILPEMRREPDARTRAYQALLIQAQWDKLIAMGAMQYGIHARLDTWLARKGMACGHPVHLDGHKQRAAIEQLGRWIRAEKRKRAEAATVSAGAATAASNAGDGA